MCEPFVGLVEEAHPEVFDIRAMPKQPKVLKPGQLEESKIRQFFEKGYLIIPEFFDTTLLDVVKKDVGQLVDDLAQILYDKHKLTDLYKDKGFHERLTYIVREFPAADIIFQKHVKLTKAMQDLWSNEKLLNLVEQFIGPEIMGLLVQAVWNWRLRTEIPPNEATTIPWHQDSAYLGNESYKILQLTAWIPLLDTNEKNGCLQVVPGAHLKGKVARHTCCWRDAWYVRLDVKDAQKRLKIDMEKDKVPCPVPYGGLLLFNNLTPHRSLNNQSDQIRWTLDFRWQKPTKNVEFYSVKTGVMMRSQKNPIRAIDWDSVNQLDTESETWKEYTDESDKESYDAPIVGTRIWKWEMSNTDRQTEKLKNTLPVSRPRK